MLPVRPARFLVGVLPLLLAAASPPSASQASAQVQVFPTQVELVTVDAVVVDDAGRPVLGLSREDFLLEEDGEVQEIVAFEAIRAPEPGAARGAAGGGAPGRQMALIVDEAHLTAEHLPAVSQALGQLLDIGLQEGDEVSLIPTVTGPWWRAKLPQGREDLLARLEQLEAQRSSASRYGISETEAEQVLREGRPIAVRGRRPSGARTQDLGAAGVSATPPAGVSAIERVRRRFSAAGECGLDCDAQIEALARELLQASRGRAEKVLDAIEQAIEVLSGRRGRKTLVFVSEGFARHPDLQRRSGEVIREAHRENVATYFLDVRSFSGAPTGSAEARFTAGAPGDLVFESMDDTLAASGAVSFTEETGGFALRAGNDLGAGLSRVAAEAGNYYLLGYEPPSDGPSDPSITVRVRRKGATVRARRTHSVGREDGALAGSSGANAREQAPFPLEMSTFVMELYEPGKALVLVASDIGPGATREKVLYRAEVTNRDTGEAFEFEKKLKPHKEAKTGAMPVVQFYLPPGIYQSRIIISELKGGRVGRQAQRFEVPALDSLRVSTPILTDLTDDAKPVIIARRRFARFSPLYVQFEILGLPPGCTAEVASGYVLMDGRGEIKRWAQASPIQPDDEGRRTRTIGIPLRELEPGPHQLALVVESSLSEAPLEIHEPFLVVDE